MKFSDLVNEALLSLKLARSRAVLTSAGIIIGVAAVMASTSAIGGVEQALYSALGLDQSRLMYISSESVEYLDPDGLAVLRKEDDSLEQVSFMRLGIQEVSSRYGNGSGSIYGVESEYFELEGIKISNGRAITKEDNIETSKVAVIGPGVVKEYFEDADSNALGSNLTIGSEQITIVGIAEADGSLDKNYSAIIVPEKTAKKRLGIESIYYGLGYLASEDYDAEQCASEATAILENYYGSGSVGKYSIVTMGEMKESLSVFSAGFSGLSMLIAVISLLVGGIGIMNMMLTNVSERVHEIGLRMAIGAMSRDIGNQFLFEAVVTSLFGCLLGIVFGYGASIAISLFMKMSMSIDVSPVLSPTYVFASLVTCLAIGLITGYYPAKKASEMKPMDALRF